MTWAAVAVGGVAAGTAIYKGVKSHREKKQAEKELEALKRPEYKVPEEITANLNQSEMMALEGMPAEQKAQYVENIQRSTATGLRASSDRKGGLVGIEGMAQAETEAYRNLLGMDIEQKNLNVERAMGARQTMANFKDTKFNINKFQPYMQKYNSEQAKLAAAKTNEMQAVDDLSAAGQSTAGSILG